MGPEGRIRTGISVVDSDPLYQLSYLGVVRHMKPTASLARKSLFRTCLLVQLLGLSV